MWRSGFSHSISYFDTWYRLMGLLAFGNRAARLRRLIVNMYGGTQYEPDDASMRQIDILTPKVLHSLHGQVARLMEGYPFRLVGLCAETGNWSTQLLKDMRPERYDFLSPV